MNINKKDDKINPYLQYYRNQVKEWSLLYSVYILCTIYIVHKIEVPGFWPAWQVLKIFYVHNSRHPSFYYTP